MNSKKIFKNQELFSFVFLDEDFTNPNQIKVHLNTDFKEMVIKPMFEEIPGETKPDLNKYADYYLSVDVGKTFFYFAFIQVFSYQRRMEFLDWQLSQCKEKMSFLHRVESLANCDYWYEFGDHSYYNSTTEEVVGDWIVARYKGDEPKQKSTLKLIKP